LCKDHGQFFVYRHGMSAHDVRATSAISPVRKFRPPLGGRDATKSPKD
jgi:hypothetical protein